MKKQQVFYIGGGESFLSREDFLERLKTKDLWHLPSDDGVAKGGWKGWLVEELGDDYEFVAPPMPNRQNAKFEEWSIWFERHFDYLNDGTILIGCSLGAMFLAKYLSSHELPFRPKMLILMAGAYQLPDFKDVSCGDFLIEPVAVQGIEKKTDKVIIMHSKDDFVVPYEHGHALAAALPEAEFISFENKNHFLIEEFPELVEKIKELG
jgi:predicted alpha/beta hydrolase family esterase